MQIENDAAVPAASLRSTLASHEEARGAKRFSLLIRTAKLVCEEGEFLCVVRDVSATGVRIKLFHSLDYANRMALVLANGDAYFIEKVWEADGQAGFRFSAPIAVESFIAEASGHPRRSVRLDIRCKGSLETGGKSMAVELSNLSCEGAGLLCDDRIAIGQQVKLVVNGLPKLIGNICWRASPAYGMVFQNGFTIEELATAAAQMQMDGYERHSMASAF